MSEEPENQPELICLNVAYHAVKQAIDEIVVKELMRRLADKKPFKLEVRFNPDPCDSTYGDWAAVKFTPPKVPAPIEEPKP